MNGFGAISLELAVTAAGLAILLLDLWTPPAQRRLTGLAAAGAVGVILIASFTLDGATRTAFGGMVVRDALALFFQRFFLLAALGVLVIATQASDRLVSGPGEYHALTLFALAGMMFAASVNDFALLFVALELITVTFYILVSFQRRRLASLEAGVKYLILGALSSAFLVYGIALIYGASGTLGFTPRADLPMTAAGERLLTTGFLLVLVGLGFKIAAVPFQMWAPDVYEGAPVSTTAFLAAGSKAAGVVLLLRVLREAPAGLVNWERLLAVLAILTLLYGALGAIPQRNLRRLMAYSGIANAGFLLVGMAAGTVEGATAVLYYLAAYLAALIVIFLVAALVWRAADPDDIPSLAGLGRRSPWLAAALTLGLVSLAGLPPTAGFFGKFLLLKAAVAGAAQNPLLYGLLAVAVITVVISLYYYFAVVRAVYWSEPASPVAPAVPVSWPARIALALGAAGVLGLGLLPGPVLHAARTAAACLRF